MLRLEASRVREVLAAAVESLGGQERPGQIQMAEAVARAMASGEHLLVQAGTGTGKSLGYLVPALLHDRRVVVATATLALQHQLVERDIPALLEAADARAATARRRTRCSRAARTTPACTGSARASPTTRARWWSCRTARWAARCSRCGRGPRSRAEAKGAGDRDSAPKHGDRVWRQVSVNHRECLGATKCPFAEECFAERAKEKAAQSQLVVTNHSLLAIDAIEGVPMIPEYDVVVIDEAHELAAPGHAGRHRRAVRAPRSSAPHAARSGTSRALEADDLADAAEALRAAYDETRPGSRRRALGSALRRARAGPRRGPRPDLGLPQGVSRTGEADAGRTQARGAVQEIFKTAERMASDLAVDVLWLSERDSKRGGDLLCVAPLQVWGPLRDRLLVGRRPWCSPARP